MRLVRLVVAVVAVASSITGVALNVRAGRHRDRSERYWARLRVADWMPVISGFLFLMLALGRKDMP